MLKKYTFIVLIFIYGCTSSGKIESINIIPRSQWNADEPKNFTQHKPVRITLHHEGTFFNQDSSALKHIKNVQKWGMGPDRNWSDIPYHYLIDGKGQIIEGRFPLTKGETNTSYDTDGHLLISVIGNYEKLQIPNELQLESIINLMTYLCKEYNISPDSIKGHKDYCKPGETDCPGNNLYKYLENGYFISNVKKLLN